MAIGQQAAARNNARLQDEVDSRNFQDFSLVFSLSILRHRKSLLVNCLRHSIKDPGEGTEERGACHIDENILPCCLVAAAHDLARQVGHVLPRVSRHEIPCQDLEVGKECRMDR